METYNAPLLRATIFGVAFWLVIILSFTVEGNDEVLIYKYCGDDGEAEILRCQDSIPVEGEWIFVLKKEAGQREVSDSLDQIENVTVKDEVTDIIKALVVTFRREETFESICNSSVVVNGTDFIEQSCLLKLADTPYSWGLDRIDQRHLPLDHSFLPADSGYGVNIYVVDTGVQLNHDDFEGRAELFFSDENEDKVQYDCEGHGTHVAGIAAGWKYGVAKKAHIQSVRIFNCAGQASLSTFLRAMDTIKTKGTSPCVVNLSFSSGGSRLIDFLVERLVDCGMVVVAAAANDDSDACNVSPARSPKVITVGASNIDDERASFSNFGSCVDIFAPGKDILSSTAGEKDTITDNTIVASGTSQAAPYVAGAAALILSRHPELTPAEVKEMLLSQATQGVLTGIGAESPNLLLWVTPKCSLDYSDYMYGLRSPECVNECEVCLDDCYYSRDGYCDESSYWDPYGWFYNICEFGTDCSDCGSRINEVCNTYCQTNGICEDGGEGSVSYNCDYGSDCEDCGVRCGPAKLHAKYSY